MKSHLIKQVQEYCKAFTRSDMILILDALEQKKPSYIQTIRIVKERKILSLETQKIYLFCLQLEVFDKQKQCKKIIEVFSSDQLKQTFEMVVQIAQQSANIIRTDFFLKVLDSYYLDQYMMYYVVEYEFFDFDSQNINQDVLEMEIYKLGFQKSVSLLLSKINQNEINIGIDDCYYVFQQKVGGLEIKLNTISPYIFRNIKINIEKQNKLSIYLPKNVLLSPYQNVLIAKEDFLLVVQSNYGDLYKDYKDFIDYLINIPFDFSSFILLTNNQNENYLTLEGITLDQKSTYFYIKKCKKVEEEKSLYQEYQTNLDMLNKVSIKHYTQAEPTISNYFILQTKQQKLKNHIKIEKFLSKKRTSNLNNYLSFIEKIISSYKIFIKLSIIPDNLYVSEDFDLIVDQRVFEQNRQKEITQLAKENAWLVQELFRCFSNYFIDYSTQKIDQIVNTYYQNFEIENINEVNNNYLNIQKVINQIKKIVSINEKDESYYQIFFYRQDLQHYAFILDYENEMQCQDLNGLISIFQENQNFKIIDFYRQIFCQEFLILQEDEEFPINFAKQLDEWLTIDKELNEEEKAKVKQLTLKFQQAKLQQDTNQNIQHAYKDLCLCQQYFDEHLEQEEDQLLWFFISSTIHVKLEQILGDYSSKVCYCYDYFKIICTLKNNQKDLQQLTFSLKMCDYVEKQLQTNSDFFNFKDNQSLFKIRILFSSELTLNQASLVYQQISTNMNKINTIELDDRGVFILMKKIKKLPRLVVLSKSQI
ncbi:hypothetical protein TTHERM_00365530 (macronuclear) [Tetrahymena thermophila SB210]|uniref:Uncharacterized protein n=1 Tax=Tetrahymena thermophila (strain SB210) TaxID=312017 RepID=Q22P88_TETTS|nr:hypothetical protein TTHERM_00365530 [Tetrahymena thermophila SB210]EAR87221.1 hypothetical protein TTHERM_00365530 [Tetrahymena thermophila SB210]|eukprot:XP_001007466.1 hypothetical protein TTHERM_00365530 [Tetrahymena thermophila SB210]